MFLWFPVLDLARAPRRTARKKGSGYENGRHCVSGSNIRDRARTGESAIGSGVLHSHLKVRVIEGDGLPSKERGGAANFRIHLTLLPKREQRFKTKTKSRYSPKFDENFEFKNVLQKDLLTTAVRFRLYGIIATGNKLVGETFLQLADIAKLDNQVIQDTWRAFRQLKKPRTKK